MFGDAEDGRKLACRILAVLFEVLVGNEKTNRKQIRFVLETTHRKPRPRPQKVGVGRRVQKHMSDFMGDGKALLDFGQILIYMYKLLSADGIEIPVNRPQIFV